MAPGTADVWQVDESGQLPAVAGVGLDDGQVLVVVHRTTAERGADCKLDINDSDEVVDGRFDEHYVALSLLTARAFAGYSWGVVDAADLVALNEDSRLLGILPYYYMGVKI